MVSDDVTVHEQVLRDVMSYLNAEPCFSVPPPEISRSVHQIIRKTTGSRDPYARAKDQSNERAKDLLPDLQNEVATADAPSVKLKGVPAHHPPAVIHGSLPAMARWISRRSASDTRRTRTFDRP